VWNETSVMVLRFASLGCGFASELITANTSEATNTIDMRFINGIALSPSHPPHRAGNRK
jgi:hypothetical protein